MIAVYVAYGEDRFHTFDFEGGTVRQPIPAGEEAHLIDCRSLKQAMYVVTSWLRDPATISVRTQRVAA